MCRWRCLAIELSPPSPLDLQPEWHAVHTHHVFVLDRPRCSRSSFGSDDALKLAPTMPASSTTLFHLSSFSRNDRPNGTPCLVRRIPHTLPQHH